MSHRTYFSILLQKYILQYIKWYSRFLPMHSPVVKHRGPIKVRKQVNIHLIMLIHPGIMKIRIM